MEPDALKVLEVRVGRLLTAVKRLKDKKAEVEARLIDVEETSKRLGREKAWVRRRLDRLMGDLDRFAAGS